MKAIIAVYHGPTDYKGATIRVKAYGVKTRVYPYPHGESRPHEACILDFASLQGWQGSLSFGTLPNGNTVATFTETARPIPGKHE